MKKYELTNETKIFKQTTFYRIRAVKDFGTVKKGELGGWIEKESNLSQDGDAWIFGNARTSGDAKIFDDARISGNAEISGKAWISGDAWISGNASISGDAKIFDDARISGNAKISGDARISGNAEISGNAWISGKNQYINFVLEVFDFTMTIQNAKIGCHCKTHIEWLEVNRNKAEELGLNGKYYAVYQSLYLAGIQYLLVNADDNNRAELQEIMEQIENRKE